MAQITRNVDDITGEELAADAESTTLTVTDGRESFTVEIDLSDVNFGKLLSAVKRYRDHGRVKTPRAARKGSNGETHSDGAAIREWGRANGWEVADRGALPKGLVEAYDTREGATDDQDA